jgi:hypothetical protein
MNKLYLLLIWITIISIGSASMVVRETITIGNFYGYILLVGAPIGVYLYFRYRTPKKETTKNAI